MKKSALWIAGILFSTSLFSAAQAQAINVKDINTIANAINECFSNGDTTCASNNIFKYIPIFPSQQSVLQSENLKNGLKVIFSAGKANFIDLAEEKRYGNSIITRIYYINMPKSTTIPSNQFLFIRYIFMKTVEGWEMTDIKFQQSGIYPPSFQ